AELQPPPRGDAPQPPDRAVRDPGPGRHTGPAPGRAGRRSGSPTGQPIAPPPLPLLLLAGLGRSGLPEVSLGLRPRVLRAADARPTRVLHSPLTLSKASRASAVGGGRARA